MRTIYGLFAPNGKCLYVGCTRNPKMRHSSHKCGKAIGGRKRFTFRIIKKVSSKRARMEEWRSITHYKALGQATFNKNTNHHSRFRTLDTKQAVDTLRAMKKGDNIAASSDADRIVILQAAGTLCAVGAIPFRITSRKNDNGGYTIYAV